MAKVYAATDTAFAIVLTLTPGATALAVATDTLWVPSGTKGPFGHKGQPRPTTDCNAPGGG